MASGKVAFGIFHEIELGEHEALDAIAGPAEARPEMGAPRHVGLLSASRNPRLTHATPGRYENGD
jgi:hypothetical protein